MFFFFFLPQQTVDTKGQNQAVLVPSDPLREQSWLSRINTSANAISSQTLVEAFRRQCFNTEDTEGLGMLQPLPLSTPHSTETSCPPLTLIFSC